MSNKKLTILGIVAATMVVWAVFQSYIANRPPRQQDVPGYLIGGIDIENIASMEIACQEETVRLINRGKEVVVASKNDYPAITGKVNSLIMACFDIRPAELITADKDNHETLGVTESTARNVVTIFDADGKPITGFYISNRPDEGDEDDNVYVRKLDEQKVYRLVQDNWPYIDTMAFIEQELVGAEKKDIQSVTLTGPDGSCTLQKRDADSDEIVLAGEMPAGKKFKGTDYKQVFEALSSLRFDDVKKADQVKGLMFDFGYICNLTDSTVYTLNIAKDEDKYYLRCTAKFTDKSTVELGRDDSDQELKKHEAKLLANDAAGKFAAKHKGWVYEIAPNKAENLTRTLDDLLEDIEAAKKADQAN